jgi:hypothetical protein
MLNSMGGQVDLLAVVLHAAGGQVEGEAAIGHDGGRPVHGPAVGRLKACEQFREGEGLYEVVVCAAIEVGDALLDGAQGGQHQDRRADSLGPQPVQHLQARQAGQQQVEYHGVEALRGRLLHAALAVAHPQAVVARLFEALAQRFAQDRVVFDHQQFHGLPHDGRPPNRGLKALLRLAPLYWQSVCRKDRGRANAAFHSENITSPPLKPSMRPLPLARPAG